MSHELYIERTHNLTVEVCNGEVEAFDSATEDGRAVRVIESGRLGFAYSTKPQISNDDLIEMARSTAENVESDPLLSFPSASKIPPFRSDTSAFSNMKIDDKKELAQRLEAKVKAFDKRIKAVRRSSYDEYIREVHISNSNGVDVKFSKGLCVIKVTAIAEENGHSEWATEIEYATDPKKLQVDEVANRASAMAASYLGGRKISSRKCLCVIDREVSSSILSLLSPAFFADSIYKNKSKFSPQSVDTKIYSPEITIIDDATMKDGFSSAPCDAEGASAVRTVLVQNGILKSFLSDTFYAKKTGTKPTSSSVRPMIAQMPRIGAQNLHIAAGNLSQDELNKEMGSGFLVTEVMGLHTANPITGDFSVGAAGFWVENGKRSYSVKGVTIAGNFHNLLKNVVKTGNDIKFLHVCGAPSLLVEDVAVSG